MAISGITPDQMTNLDNEIKVVKELVTGLKSSLSSSSDGEKHLKTAAKNSIAVMMLSKSIGNVILHNYITSVLNMCILDTKCDSELNNLTDVTPVNLISNSKKMLTCYLSKETPGNLKNLQKSDVISDEMKTAITACLEKKPK